MESKQGEMHKSVIGAVSHKDESVSEILSRLDELSEVIQRVDKYYEREQTQPDEESVSDFEEAKESFLVETE